LPRLLHCEHEYALPHADCLRCNRRKPKWLVTEDDRHGAQFSPGRVGQISIGADILDLRSNQGPTD
jgi:hypothetical protein